MSDTATVETITAEVRTLMVGSRQITASVYGQLDLRDGRRIVPFGRVQPKDAKPGRVYVVGKDPETGELVRAETPSAQRLIEATVKERSKADAWENAQHTLNGKGGKCDDEADAADEQAERRLTGDIYNSAAHYDQEAAEALAAEASAAELREKAKGHWAEADKAELQVEEWEKRDTAEVERLGALADEWSGLPLIVLAGLR
jgi:hypothetical protein